jgi:Family of unknown function (DUF6662)
LLLRSLRSLLVPVVALVALLATAAHADENFFGYSYGSETLPKGKWELYNWLTWRTSKGAGDYDALDLKQEIEYGITDRFQASLYLNERYHAIEDSAPLEENDEGEEEPEFGNRDEFAFQGVQLAFKYNVLSPYEDPLGLALYLEPGYSRIDKISGEHEDEWELEAKLILQKNFLDDQLIAVLNISPEMEWEKGRGEHETETELPLEFTGGLIYRLAPKWYAGVEARYHSEYPNFPDEITREHWAMFVGPVIHYGAERWWFTLTALPQVYGKPQEEERSHTLHLAEHERFELRLKTGINF